MKKNVWPYLILGGLLFWWLFGRRVDARVWVDEEGVSVRYR
jgi:hypothetical protein